jgi:hypothetical protein
MGRDDASPWSLVVFGWPGTPTTGQRSNDTGPAPTKMQPPRPSSRRHGFTPRNTSSRAHQAKAPTPIESMAVQASCRWATTQRNAMVRRKIHSGTFGNWATVIRHVWRLRNNQSNTRPVRRWWPRARLGVGGFGRSRSRVLGHSTGASLSGGTSGGPSQSERVESGQGFATVGNGHDHGHYCIESVASPGPQICFVSSCW